jgi:hypothetical protein
MLGMQLTKTSDPPQSVLLWQGVRGQNERDTPYES